jgi:hypothetical protein
MITDVATTAIEEEDKLHILHWIDTQKVPKLLCHSHTQLLQVDTHFTCYINECCELYCAAIV